MYVCAFTVKTTISALKALGVLGFGHVENKHDSRSLFSVELIHQTADRQDRAVLMSSEMSSCSNSDDAKKNKTKRSPHVTLGYYDTMSQRHRRTEGQAQKDGGTEQI